ncbi:MAG: FAS1-like dehydratase domain-containing protein [Actinomycetota bacterium]
MVEETITFELPVTEETIKDFAVAVGEDDNPFFFDADAAREQGLPDVVAPPTFTVRQIFEVPRDERERRLGANLEYARVLHGEQEFVYNRLPIAGEVLNGTMRISKDFEKEGKRGGTMRFVTYETVFTDANGDEVLTQYYTLLQTAKDVG